MKTQAFIERTHELASWFTNPCWVDVSKVGKYSVNGLKPIEAFCSDISANLVNWAAEGSAVFYRTKEYWYMFDKVREGPLEGVIQMTRYRNGSWERLDDWANASSLKNMGKNGLLADNQHLRLPLFNS